MNESLAVRPLSTFGSWISCRRLPQGDEGATNPIQSYCPKRVGHVAVCIMDELLVWGGYFQTHLGTVYCDKHEVWNFNLDMDRWFRYIPSGRGPHHTSGACSVVLWPYWYILFGHTKHGNTNEMFRLNLQICWWESIQPIGLTITPRDKCVAWAYDKKIFIFGGFGYCSVNGYTLWNDETDVYQIEEMGDERGWNNQFASFDPSTHTWQLVNDRGPRPTARAAHSAVQVEDEVYIYGGRFCETRRADLHRLNLTTLTWSGELACEGPQPEERSWHTMAALDRRRLILMGGYNTNGEILEDLWVLNLEPLSWSLLRRFTRTPRLWHTACTNSMGDVLIYGGCTNNILDDTVRNQTSDQILTVRLEPFSLERLCLHNLWVNRYLDPNTRHYLPPICKTWLKDRIRTFGELNRCIHKCLAIAIYGPNLTQLSVMPEAAVDFINTNNYDVERRRNHLQQWN